MSSNVESTFSYDSASVNVLVISNRADFFKSVRNRLKLIFFMSLKFTCFLIGGGLASKKFAVYRGMVGNSRVNDINI